MVDWSLAIKIFISGVTIVMFVMAMLQVSVLLTSFVVRNLEKRMQTNKETLNLKG